MLLNKYREVARWVYASNTVLGSDLLTEKETEFSSLLGKDKKNVCLSGGEVHFMYT